MSFKRRQKPMVSRMLKAALSVAPVCGSVPIAGNVVSLAIVFAIWEPASSVDMVRQSFLYFTIRGDQPDGACVLADRNLSRLHRGGTAWISTVEPEFVGVELMISSLRGVHPHENGSLSKQRSCGGSIL